MKNRVAYAIILLAAVMALYLAWGKQPVSPESVDNALRSGMSPIEVETSLGLPNGTLKLDRDSQGYIAVVSEPGIGCVFSRQYEIVLAFDEGRKLIEGWSNQACFGVEGKGRSVRLRP